MASMGFAEAVEDVLADRMAEDARILVMGEDVRMIRHNLYARFGGERVRETPISEAAFVGAAVAAAMAGLRPVVEVMLVDFIGVCIDALLNHAAKLEALSGGSWKAPLVVRTTCGGGYGDGGQHAQCLWGWLAHIPGLAVVAPATPADAGGLMLTALQSEGPVVFLEHRLLSTDWLDLLGRGGRATVHFDIPPAGARGPVPDAWKPIPFGQALVRRRGPDLTILSLSAGVHRALEAAEVLEAQGIGATVLDLRTVAPLDRQAVQEAAAQTGRVLVVDEDYQDCGLSGELAASLLEAGVPARFGRVCTRTTIPYAREQERAVLPNVPRIVDAARELMR